MLGTSMTGIEAFVSDLVFALHGWRRRPGFAATGVLVLAIGIGATTVLKKPFDLRTLDEAISNASSSPPDPNGDDEDPGRTFVLRRRE